MLQADKNNLTTEVTVELLHLRERELQYNTMHCNQIGVASSVLIGLAIQFVVSERPRATCALADESAPPETWVCTPAGADARHLVFQLLSVSALSAFTMVNVTSLLLSVLAPRLALHGPPGSMHRAVDGLHRHRKIVTGIFHAGLAAFFGSAAVYPWMYFPLAIALPTSGTIALGGLFTFGSVVWVRRSFHVRSGEKVRGWYDLRRARRSRSRSMGAGEEPATPSRVISLMQSKILPKVPPSREAAAKPSAMFGELLASLTPWAVASRAAYRRAAVGDSSLGRGQPLSTPRGDGERDSAAPSSSKARVACDAVPAAAPIVRLVTSHGVMAEVELLERQGRFREAAELLAERLVAIKAAADASDAGSAIELATDDDRSDGDDDSVVPAKRLSASSKGYTLFDGSPQAFQLDQPRRVSRGGARTTGRLTSAGGWLTGWNVWGWNLF